VFSVGFELRRSKLEFEVRRSRLARRTENVNAEPNKEHEPRSENREVRTMPRLCA
jgi:hypothetical protein